jgi:hypothetical protein
VNGDGEWLLVPTKQRTKFFPLQSPCRLNYPCTCSLIRKFPRENREWVPIRFVRKGLKVYDKLATKVVPVIDAVARKMLEPLQRVLPKDNGQVRYYDVLRSPSGPGSSCVDANQSLGSCLARICRRWWPWSWVAIELPKARGKGRDSAYLPVLLVMVMMMVPRRQVMSERELGLHLFPN